MAAIALVSGIYELYAQIGIFFLTFTTQMLGLVAEYSLSLYSADIEGKYAKDLRNLAYISHFAGWVSMMAAYGIVWRQFDKNIQSSDLSPPDFVYVIVIGLFLLYNIFGFSQFFQILIKTGCCEKKDSEKKDKCCRDREDCCQWPKCRGSVCSKDRCCGSKSTNVAVESFFVWNSLISKTLLGWMIYANLLVRDEFDIETCW